MEDDDAKRMRIQINQLARDVAAARHEARVARWCSTQVAIVMLDLLTKRDVVTRTEARSHFESTLAMIRPHRKQQGMAELARELEFLLGKLGSDPRGSQGDSGELHSSRVN